MILVNQVLENNHQCAHCIENHFYKYSGIQSAWHWEFITHQFPLNNFPTIVDFFYFF